MDKITPNPTPDQNDRSNRTTRSEDRVIEILRRLSAQIERIRLEPFSREEYLQLEELRDRTTTINKYKKEE